MGWGIIGDVVGKVVGSVSNGVSNVAKVFVGSKAERDQQTHNQTMGAQAQFSNEFKENKSYWDSFIDGLNRLPRPAFVLHILAFFWLAYLDPTEFQILCVSLKAVPVMVWEYLRVIIMFYFGGRIVQSVINSKTTMSMEQFKGMMDQIDQLRANEKEREEKEKQAEKDKIDAEFAEQDAIDKAEFDKEAEEFMKNLKGD